MAVRMTHWSDRWLGRAYIEGVYECWDLVVDVRLKFGGDENTLWRHLVRGAAPAARALMFRAAAAEGLIARPLAEGEPPLEGDGLSMFELGARRATHAGILVALDAGAPPAHVLHCTPDAGVVRQRLTDLHTTGYEPDAVWRFL